MAPSFLTDLVLQKELHILLRPRLILFQNTWSTGLVYKQDFGRSAQNHEKLE